MQGSSSLGGYILSWLQSSKDPYKPFQQREIHGNSSFLLVLYSKEMCQGTDMRLGDTSLVVVRAEPRPAETQ